MMLNPPAAPPAVLILNGVLQGGDVNPVLHKHVGRMLKHFWVQVFFSSKDPSKLKLYSSKEEVRARVNNRVVMVVSLQNPVGALEGIQDQGHRLTRGSCQGRRLPSSPRSTPRHGPACHHRLQAGLDQGRGRTLPSHILC